jgi:nitrate reductase beta subunit
MAFGEFSLFQWKNKEQLDKEAREYENWAFPYGELQRTNLMALLSELRPKEAQEILLVSFLTCKEDYENILAGSQTDEEAISKMLNSSKGYIRLVKKADRIMFIAVLLADVCLDEACLYPSADEILKRVQELEELRKTK